MKKFLLIVCLVVGFLQLKGQENLTFTNLDGFPDLVEDGESYTLYGYIKNTGTSSSPTVVDVNMGVNGNNIIIQNNFNLGAALAPGDSAFWYYPGYIFPSALFSGGQNDILIWPTSPSEGGSDTLKKQIYYSRKAAFTVRRETIDGLEEEIDPSKFYGLRISAVNVGAKENTQPVGFYMRYESGPVVFLGSVPGIYKQGDTVTFEYIPSGLFILNYYLFLFSDFGNSPATCEFWAREFEPPVEKATFEVMYATRFEDKSPKALISVYPVPARDYLFIEAGHLEPGAVSSMEIFDETGRKVMSKNEFCASLEVSEMPAGIYYLVLMIHERPVVRRISVVH